MQDNFKIGDDVTLRKELSEVALLKLKEIKSDIPEFNRRYRVIGLEKNGLILRDLNTGKGSSWKSKFWKKMEPRYKSDLTMELAMSRNYFDEGCRILNKEYLKIFNQNADF